MTALLVQAHPEGTVVYHNLPWWVFAVVLAAAVLYGFRNPDKW